MKKLDIVTVIGMFILIGVWSILPPKISQAEQKVQKAPVPQKQEKNIDKDIENLLALDKEFTKKYVLEKKKEVNYKIKLEKKVKRQEYQIKALNSQLDTLVALQKAEDCNCDSVENIKNKRKNFLQRIFNKE